MRRDDAEPLLSEASVRRMLLQSLNNYLAQLSPLFVLRDQLEGPDSLHLLDFFLALLLVLLPDLVEALLVDLTRSVQAVQVLLEEAIEAALQHHGGQYVDVVVWTGRH